MNVQSIPPTIYTAPPRATLDDLTLNEPNLDIRGGTVRVEALLDFDGLSQLEEHLKALKMLLKPKRAVIAISDNEITEEGVKDLPPLLR